MRISKTIVFLLTLIFFGNSGIIKAGTLLFGPNESNKQGLGFRDGNTCYVVTHTSGSKDEFTYVLDSKGKRSSIALVGRDAEHDLSVYRLGTEKKLLRYKKPSRNQSAMSLEEIEQYREQLRVANMCSHPRRSTGRQTDSAVYPVFWYNDIELNAQHRLIDVEYQVPDGNLHKIRLSEVSSTLKLGSPIYYKSSPIAVQSYWVY